MSGTRLAGQTALVTGASSGIGAAVARRLGAAGARVILAGRDADRLHAVRSELPAGPVHRCVHVELADAGSIGAMAQDVRDSAGRIDVLVHSAGLFEPQPFEQIPVDALDRAWAVNARGPFLVTQALVPLMPPGSSVVFVSSVSGHVGMTGQSAYGMTKSAIDGLARTLAVELAPRGIRVNAVAPGFTATPMNERLRAELGRVTRIEAATLAGRLAAADDIARAVTFLTSADAAFIYGVTLQVDGGYPTSNIQTGATQ